MAEAGRQARGTHRRLTRFCGQAKSLIRFHESDPSTDIHRVVHRRPGHVAQRDEVGRLPSSGFGENVNRPRDTAARKSGETGVSSGSVRLSDQGFQSHFGGRGKPGQGPGSQPLALRCGGTENQTGIGGRRMGQKPGRDAIGQEPPGYSRPSPGSPAGTDARVRKPQWPSPNPDLVGGRQHRLDRTCVPSLNSASEGYRSTRGVSRLEPGFRLLPVPTGWEVGPPAAWRGWRGS